MDIIKKLQLAAQKIQFAKKILLVGHTSPDPDALASIGAMLELLYDLKIEVTTYAENKPAHVYSFIPHEDKISTDKPYNLNEFSVILILDCGSISRTGLEKELREVVIKRKEGNNKEPYIIEFDHHGSQEGFSDLEIRLVNKASTTEVINDFFEINEFKINKIVADCILIGLMADTGNFLHANSSFDVLRVSSKMLLKGASLSKISNQVRGSINLPVLKIWGRVLEKIKFNKETGLISSGLSEKDLDSLLSPREREMSADAFGDIVSFMSYLSGVKIALLLRESKGTVKGSLRTNCNGVDLNLLARKFGGGGHKRAAGFMINGYLEETNNGWRVRD